MRKDAVMMKDLLGMGGEVTTTDIEQHGGVYGGDPVTFARVEMRGGARRYFMYLCDGFHEITEPEYDTMMRMLRPPVGPKQGYGP